MAIDLGVLAIAFGVAFLLRFDGVLPEQILKRFLFLWPYVILFQYLVLYAFGVPQFAWRYVGLREPVRIFVALATAAAVLLAVRLGAGAFFDIVQGRAQWVVVPISIIMMDLMLAALGISGVRVVRRLQVEYRDSKRRRGTGG